MRIRLFIVFVLSLLVPAGMTAAQSGGELRGRVSDSASGEPVGFATVVAMRPDSSVVSATVASDKGTWSMSLAPASYIINVNCIGYRPVSLTHEITAAPEPLEIGMSQAAVDVDEVRVRAARITREADRYVISVAGTMEAIGKTAEEFLRTAPAVWIQDDKILVDGRSGARIVVNERVLNMDDEQTITYLRTIQADDIARIEVIPRAGADYDADAMGGVIKITLKRKRDSGLEITPAFRYTVGGGNQQAYNPNITVNYRVKDFSFYGHLYNDHFLSDMILEEHNLTPTTSLDSYSAGRGRTHNGGGRFGVIYDLGDNHSVGAEYAFYSDNTFTDMNPMSYVFSPDRNTVDSSAYRQNDKRRNNYAAVNYVWKIDSLGSVFKVIADFSNTRSPARNNYYTRHSVLTGAEAGFFRDTLYRNEGANAYKTVTATASIEKYLSARSRMNAGVKFIYNALDNDSRYYGQESSRWVLDTRQSLVQDYREKIGAGYVTFNSSVGIVQYGLGLRAEYTHATPTTQLFDGTSPEKSKNTYFSLFPNVNVTVPLQREKGYSVTAFYARKIQRPQLWAMNPFRMQVSEYSYIVGDPLLKPSYSDEAGLTLVLKHKFSITGGYRNTTDIVQQYVTQDTVDPNAVVYKHTNLSRAKDLYVSVNLPFQITDKISLGSNIYYTNSRTTADKTTGNIMANNMVYANAQLGIGLPKGFRIETTGWFQSSALWGNMLMRSMGDLDIGLRKRFFGDALSASLNLQSVLCINSGNRITIRQEGLTRTISEKSNWHNRRFNMSIQYNFKSGKKANGRQVERGGDESR